MSHVKTLARAAVLLSLAVLPGTAGAQSLRLEDPIRQQERWQRDQDRDARDRTRDARDEERDRAILREIQDQAREQRLRDEDREMREQIREDERKRERDQDWLERKRERDGTCNSSSASYNPTFCPRGTR
jgi:hypothetical protein